MYGMAMPRPIGAGLDASHFVFSEASAVSEIFTEVSKFGMAREPIR